ncbi:carbon starvation CstA family protein [Luteimonas abyssi]|uniref:carbon starvation CstA family protein n=1 Tax=Luteimonas abyssi TaxID=1247514 RepID=UPI000737ACD9|nr:carbon starvation protein A [Luteimonas abyssi]
MNAIVLLVLGVGIMLLGYFIYSKFIAERIYRLDPDFVTPAHTMRDNVDYLPTNRFVLWAHHTTSVAGAAPIVGPAIAVIWGWAPAFLWVALGTVFFAGVHDLGALWASARNRGKSIGTLAGSFIGARGRNLFLVVIFLLLMMVNAAFAVVIANLFVSTPSSVIPVWSAVIVALIIGQLMHRTNIRLLWPSVIGLAFLYAMVLVGEQVPVSLPESLFGLTERSQWILLLFVYCGIASMLPVWMLLQPRDYINGMQLGIGIGILFLGVVLAAPTLAAPAFNTNVPAGTPGLLPLLFVTIACGAISGFHGLVSSGTTSKQLDKETDARFIGYGGAVGEGLLALAAIIACTAGFASLVEWEAVYDQFGGGNVAAFVQGGSTLLTAGLGIPATLGATLLATMVVLFAATTMDSGVRLQRYVIQEAAEIAGLRVGGVVGTLIAVGFCVALAFGAGEEGTGGMVIWPLFGTTNQLMAALTLSIVSVILIQLKRPAWMTAIPLVFLLIMTVYALLVQLRQFYEDGNWLLVGMDLVILVAALWVALEAATVINRTRREAREGAGPARDA